MQKMRLTSGHRRITVVRRILVAAGILIFATTLTPRARAAGGAPAIDPHLAFMGPLIGSTWSGTLLSPDGGQRSTVIRTFEVLDGGHVIRATKVNRELHSRGEGFVYWDDVRKQVSFFFIENGGVFLTGKVTGEGKVVTFEGTMTWPAPPPRPDVKQAFEFRNSFELLSEATLRDSWFQNAFGPWRSGHVIDFEAQPADQDAWREMTGFHGPALTVPTLPPSGWTPRWPPNLVGPWLGQALPADRPTLVAEGLVALGNHEHHLTASPTGEELLWVIADKYRTRHTIVRVVQVDGVWQAPEIAPFSGRFNDFAPSFHPDGSALLFSSNRPLPGTDEPTPDANIWRVGRTGTGWGEPQPLPAPINDESAEYNPSITRDGLLVFQDHDANGADLYSSRLVDGSWTVPEKTLGVNTPGPEITPFVSADGKLLLFASDRPGGLGAMDIWASRRLDDGTWSAPQNLGERVNSPASEAVPTLSPDGSLLFVTSFAGFGPTALRDRTYGELVHLLRSATNGDGTLYWVATAGLLPVPTSGDRGPN